MSPEAKGAPASSRPLFLQPRMLLLVMAGGTVGTLARALLEASWPASAGSWPWTTFGINLLGAFLLGMLYSLLAAWGPNTGWRRALRVGGGTGVMGGFTTYSTFIVEADRLGALTPGLGIAYAVGSVLLGIAAAALGTWIGVAASRTAGGQS